MRIFKAIIKRDLALSKKQKKDIIICLLFSIFFPLLPIISIVIGYTPIEKKQIIDLFSIIYVIIVPLVCGIQFTLDICSSEKSNHMFDLLFRLKLNKIKLLLAKMGTPGLIGVAGFLIAILECKFIIFASISVLDLLKILFTGLVGEILGIIIPIILSFFIERLSDFAILSGVLTFVLFGFLLFITNPMVHSFWILTILSLFLIISLLAACIAIMNLKETKLHFENFIKKIDV